MKLRIMESVNLDDGYKYVSNKFGYYLYKKRIHDDSGKLVKVLWAAQKWDGKNSRLVGEPFEITYEQARGFEPIEPSDTQLGDLQKKVSKALGFGRYRDIEESSENKKKEVVKEDLYHDAQKEVYNFFMKKQWDLNIPEVANYAESVAEYLELDPEFATGEYTMRDWYKDTQINYPEDIEWLDSTAY